MSAVILLLEKVLKLESETFPDWSAISTECNTIIEIINEEGLDEFRGTVAYRFAEDYDVRQKSEKYAMSQREELRQWLAKFRGELR